MSRIKRTYTITLDNVDKIKDLQKLLSDKYYNSFSQSDVVNYAIAHLPGLFEAEEKLKLFTDEITRLKKIEGDKNAI